VSSHLKRCVVASLTILLACVLTGCGEEVQTGRVTGPSPTYRAPAESDALGPPATAAATTAAGEGPQKSATPPGAELRPAAAALPTATGVEPEKEAVTGTPATPTRPATSTATPTEAQPTAACPEQTPGTPWQQLEPPLPLLVESAMADLAEQRQIPIQSVQFRTARAVQWRDSSLGCPERGNAFLTVITPGYLIQLEVEGALFEYHADDTELFLCLSPQPPLDD